MENPYQTPVAEPPPLPTHSLQGLRPVYPMAATALWMLAVCGGFGVIDHVVKMLAAPASVPSHDSYYLQGPTAFEWIVVALGFGSMVPYLIWKYRVVWNAARLDPDAVTVSPAMAVGSYFIPFVNFYLPCKAMAQAAKASTGTTRGVAAWWATQWGSMLFGVVIGFTYNGNTPARPGVLDHLYIILSVVTTVAAWKLMMGITRAQMAAEQAPD